MGPFGYWFNHVAGRSDRPGCHQCRFGPQHPRLHAAVACNSRPPDRHNSGSFIKWRSIFLGQCSGLHRYTCDPGTGFDLFPADGLFDEPVEDVYFDIPVANFASLPAGINNVYVLGLDLAGNWGAAGSAELTITETVADITPPDIQNLTITQINRNRIRLTGTATDTQSPIVRVEWMLVGQPGSPMEPTDGAFDTTTEGFEATINIRQWNLPVTIEVVAMDANGNWNIPESIPYP